MKIITHEHKRPLYGNYISISKNKLDKAIRFGAKILVKIPGGEELVDPAEWKTRGKVTKQVFLRPDDPMILYWGNVKVEEIKQNKLF